MWERSSDFIVVLTVRGWMKKRQTKKKQNNEKQILRKKAKQGEEWWGKINFRDKKGEENRTWGKKG
jgi:hypothetical protein